MNTRHLPLLALLLLLALPAPSLACGPAGAVLLAPIILGALVVKAVGQAYLALVAALPWIAASAAAVLALGAIFTQLHRRAS